MAYWKKQYSKSKQVYFPQAIVQGKPVETEEIAQNLALISTVSNSDVQAVLGDISTVIHNFLKQGKAVHIKGLGNFRYVIDSKGVATLDEFDFDKQVEAVRVAFTPERSKTSSGSYTRALVDTTKLEWIELPSTAVDSSEDSDSGGSSDSGDEEVNPFG